MSDLARPTNVEVDAAARVLFEAGSRHRWWPTFTRTYDEMIANDLIAKEEFEAIVEQVLIAACKARRDEAS